VDWTEPGAHAVAAGVHRIPLPLPNDGLRAVNVYALHTDDGLVLVDAGWAIPAAREQLVTSLGEIGADLGDVRRFLVTHVHRDHYTNAVAVRREVGASVALGAGERDTLDLLNDEQRTPLQAQIDALRRLGAPALADGLAKVVSGHRPDLADWEAPDVWLTGGELLTLPGGRLLDVVETPGHTVGHVVFHDVAAGLLFAGDHVLPTITPSIGFEPALSDDPLGAFLRSLAVVRARPDAMLLPAHGPVTDSVHARVDELTAHHGQRLDEAEKAVRDGATCAADVAGVLRWTRRERALEELDGFNRMLAVFETGAHLALLAIQGRLRGEMSDGVLTYTA
jgi:glyoxylase-like metal-dependent hydrolase (beta-lactamase superfamily II)